VAIVGSGTAREVWYVRWLESLGGDQYRLRGVMRHRHFSAKQAWPAGTPVVLFDVDAVQDFTDLLMAPQESVYLKSQPIGNASIVLADIDSEQLDLYGEGVRPLPVSALRAGDPGGAQSNSYYFPNDVTIRWGWRAKPGPSDGCPAELGAGDPVFVVPPSDGTVRLRVTNPNDGDAEVRVVDLELDVDGTYVYTQEQIKTDFGLSAGYTPSSGILNLRSAATSPTVTNTGSIPLVCGGSPSGGNFSDFTPATLDTGTGSPSSASVTISNLSARGMLFVTGAGVPGLASPGPVGGFALTVEITAVTGGGASFQPLCAFLVRLDEDNDILQAIGMTEDDPAAVTGPMTKTWAATVGSWSAWNSSDRLGVNIVPKDTGGGATDFVFEVDSGASFLQNDSLAVAGIDFDVEVSVIKGAQQSALQTIAVENLGGTTT
jgi:hypothetical protein